MKLASDGASESTALVIWKLTNVSNTAGLEILGEKIDAIRQKWGSL